MRGLCRSRLRWQLIPTFVRPVAGSARFDTHNTWTGDGTSVCLEHCRDRSTAGSAAAPCSQYVRALGLSAPANTVDSTVGQKAVDARLQRARSYEASRTLVSTSLCCGRLVACTEAPSIKFVANRLRSWARIPDCNSETSVSKTRDKQPKSLIFEHVLRRERIHQVTGDATGPVLDDNAQNDVRSVVREQSGKVSGRLAIAIGWHSS